jgi:nicotinamide riboside transporter PnuC
VSLVEWIAASFGVAGALLLATNFHPAWGFVMYAVSNVGWIAFSLRRRLRALLAQQVVFMLTTLIGLWNWWLGPLLLGGSR